MKYITAKGQRLSRFCLGTVQLGMEYGLGVHKEKPSREAAFSILDQAMALGINTLDTANNYGDSEAIIGAWLAQRKAESKPLPQIVTKIGPMKQGAYRNLRDAVLYQTEACRKTLGVDTIDYLMLHNFEDYEENRDSMQTLFRELKEQGFCHYSALSAYSRHDYSLIADSGFDAVQIPINIFDWTQLKNGGLQKIADAGMMIFARSVFLQGLVFQTPETLDPRMDFCLPYLQEFHSLCREFELPAPVLALSFVLSLPGVTQVVLGCDTADQVAQNCALFDKIVPLTETQFAQLRKAFCKIDPKVTDPGRWFNAGR
ncbi:MAG: aldo/keto reductase [Oscillospiraceae bacterium]|nr:aldo/keto reductase [Oscillospiraceae bacterium]